MNNNRQSRSPSRQSLSCYPPLQFSLRYIYIYINSVCVFCFVVAFLPHSVQTRPDQKVCSACMRVEWILVARAPSTHTQSSPSRGSHRISNSGGARTPSTEIKTWAGTVTKSQPTQSQGVCSFFFIHFVISGWCAICSVSLSTRKPIFASGKHFFFLLKFLLFLSRFFLHWDDGIWSMKTVLCVSRRCGLAIWLPFFLFGGCSLPGFWLQRVCASVERNTHSGWLEAKKNKKNYEQVEQCPVDRFGVCVRRIAGFITSGVFPLLFLWPSLFPPPTGLGLASLWFTSSSSSVILI